MTPCMSSCPNEPFRAKFVSHMYLFDPLLALNPIVVDQAGSTVFLRWVWWISHLSRAVLLCEVSVCVSVCLSGSMAKLVDAVMFTLRTLCALPNDFVLLNTRAMLQEIAAI